MASVTSTDSKVGFIDLDGKYVINPQFISATKFFNDISFVSIGGKYGIINRKGLIVVNPQFDYINSDAQYFKTIRSDYFDVNSVLNGILENSTPDMFRKMNSQTTFATIKTMYPGILEMDFAEMGNSQIGITPSEVLSDMAMLNYIKFSFNGDFVSQIPKFQDVQKYDATQGGYITVQEFERYENNFNDSVNLDRLYLEIQLLGKANTKSKDITIGLKQAFMDMYRLKEMGNDTNTKDRIYLQNEKMQIILYDMGDDFISFAICFHANGCD